MGIVQIKCPNCGASLEMERGQTVVSCTYCGSDFMVDAQTRSSIDAEAVGFPCKPVTIDALKTMAMLWMTQAEYMPADLPAEIHFEHCKLLYVPVYVQTVKYTASYHARIGTDNTKTYTEVRNGQSYRKNEAITNWQLAGGNVEGEATVRLFGAQAEKIIGIKDADAKSFVHEESELQKLSKLNIKSDSIVPGGQPRIEAVHRKLEPAVKNKVRRALPRGKQKDVRWNIKTDVLEQSCVYVPVWNLVYSYKNETFGFVIDGYNPETVFGFRPVDRDMYHAEQERQTQQEMKTRQTAFLASLPAKILFGAGIILLLFAFSSGTHVLSYVGFASLVGAVVFYFISRDVRQRAINSVPAKQLLPNAILRNKLLTLYSDGALSLDEKMKRASRLSKDTAHIAADGNLTHEYDRSVHTDAKAPRPPKKTFSKTTFILLLSAIAVLLVAGCWAIISMIAGKKTAVREAAAAGSISTAQAVLSEEPVVTPHSIFTPQSTASPEKADYSAYETKTISEVKAEGQWDNYDLLSPRANGIGLTQDWEFQPKTQFLVRIGGAWYQGYDESTSGERYIYLHHTETGSPANADWDWYRLDSVIPLPDYSTAAETQSDSAFNPIGEWVCIGLYNPYEAAVQVDYYQAIPPEYLSPVNDTLELHISADALTQIVNGKEYASFPWHMNGQTIHVTLPAQSEYYGYYQVDANTIHEFYADSELYVYTRK